MLVRHQVHSVADAAFGCKVIQPAVFPQALDAHPGSTELALLEVGLGPTARAAFALQGGEGWGPRGGGTSSSWPGWSMPWRSQSLLGMSMKSTEAFALEEINNFVHPSTRT